MGGITKLGLALLLIFLSVMLVLVAELLYILWRRRRLQLRLRRPSACCDDPELVAGDRLGSKDLIPCLLCFKNQSRIEPASDRLAAAAAATEALPKSPDAAVEEDGDGDLERWQTMRCGVLMTLFTIQEEEEEEKGETESDDSGRITSASGGRGGGEAAATHPGSPPFYTPASSPLSDGSAADQLERGSDAGDHSPATAGDGGSTVIQ